MHKTDTRKLQLVAYVEITLRQFAPCALDSVLATGRIVDDQWRCFDEA